MSEDIEQNEVIEETPEESVETTEAEVEIDPSESVEAERDALKRAEEEDSADKTDGPSESILQKIKNKLTGNKEKEETSKEEAIPDNFSAAARDAGWSDEDIVEFASGYKNEELEDMIQFLVDGEEVEEDEEVEEKPKEEVKEVKEEKKDDEVAKLRAELDSIKKALEEGKATEKKNETKAMGDQAESFLDKASESFEVFGKAKELPKFPDGRLIPNSPQYKARAELLGHALKFYTMGEGWPSALENALTMYKGKHLEKDIERRVIQNLKRNSKKLSPDRQGKITEKKYVDETAREADVVVQAARKAGLKKFDK